jgi:hypothetical protein
LASYISVNNKDILKFSKAVKSFVHALFSFIFTSTKIINFNQVFMAKTPLSCVLAPFRTFRVAWKSYLTSLTPSTTIPAQAIPPPIVGATSSSCAALMVSSSF